MTQLKSLTAQLLALLLVISYCSREAAHASRKSPGDIFKLQVLRRQNVPVPERKALNDLINNSGGLINDNNDYLQEISAEGLYSWPLAKMPLRLFISDGHNIFGYRSNYPDILKGCFDEWVAASNYRLAWSEVKKPEDADIVVNWTADAQERVEGTEAGRTRTYTHFDTRTNRGVIYKAMMTLLTRLPERQMDENEIKKTFLHEVGHVFGLAGHSLQRKDIMFTRVSPTQPPFLSLRDKSTIMKLYSAYPQQTAVNNAQYVKHGRSGLAKQGV